MHQRQYIKNKLKELDKTLNNSRTLLILMHDYPDPDAIASAMILSFLAQKRQGIKTRIAYGGVITRAENRALVQQVGLKLIHKKNVRWKNYQSIAMVDTQPSFGNHSLPKAIIPKNVFDHHPPGDCLSIDFVDIRTEFGTCATMLLEYIKAAGLEISVDIATALAYAIRSETQDLGREASPDDIATYLSVYPKANKKKLTKIVNPMLPKTYYTLLQTALNRAQIFKHLIHVHLGKISSPEEVSQIADLLLQHERIGWTIATGQHQNHLFISIRTNNPNGHAGNKLKQIIGKMGSAGGHAKMAGGQIDYTAQKKRNWQRLEDIVTSRFVTKLGYKRNVDWKPMLNKE